MTWCEAQFLSFNNAIKLDAERKQRIDGAVTRLVEFCNTDGQLSAALQGELFFQGSVATRTVVKPLAKQEFDVDLIYPFRRNAFAAGTTPSQIMDWFRGRFAASGFYSPRQIDKDRCVRVDYAGDFHLDITPATRDVADCQPWAIATKDSPNWEKSDPIGFINWVKAIDDRADGLDGDGVRRFVRCARYMKRWRDSAFSEETAPKSIVLVTALGKHDPSSKNYNPPIENPLYPQYQTDSAYLFDMLRLTHSCIMGRRGTAFSHPTTGEDLGGEWADANFDLFVGQLSRCINHLRNAIYADAEATSIQHYKATLGDTFPA
jgi:hypothetical protein